MQTSGEIACGRKLAEISERLDELLVPWGFTFCDQSTGHATAGAFAAGFYVRAQTQIGLVYRRSHGMGVVVYRKQFVTEFPSVREIERFSIDHAQYMSALGYESDCRLQIDGIHSVACDGDDPVSALIHDLRNRAAATLATECSEFSDIIRNGLRQFWTES